MKSEKYIIITAIIFISLLTLLFIFSTKNIREEYINTCKKLNGISKIVKIYQIDIKLKALRGLSQLNDRYENKLKKNLFIDEDEIAREINNLNDKNIIIAYNKIIENRDKYSRFSIFNHYTKLINLLEHKIINIASESNLFSDTNKDSYYLMSLFIIYIPDIVENVGQIRGLGTGFLSSTEQNNEEIKILLKLNIENFKNKVKNIKFYITKLNPVIQNELNDRLDNILNSFYELNKIVDNILKNSYLINPPDYFLKASLLINKINLLFVDIKNQIFEKLEKRKTELSLKITIAFIIYFIIILLTLVIFFTYYQKIKKENILKKVEEEQQKLTNRLRDKYLKSLTLKEICKISLEFIINYFKALNGLIFIYDNKNEKLYLCCSYAVNQANLKQVINVNDTIMGEALIKKDVKIIDIRQEINVGNIILKSSKLVTIPLFEFRKPVGVIQLLFDDNFKKIDLKFLKRITLLMATHIQRTQFEEELKSYVNLIDKHVIISRTDSNGVIIEVSELFCKLFEFSRDELIGKTHRVLHHNDTPDDLIKDLWETILKGKVWEGEIKNKTKSGKDVWVYTIITPDKDINGNIIGFTAIRYDITDKKIIEKLSITDGLTCLYNRRHFDEIFPKQINIAKRTNQKLAFGIIDIDHFKQYNDIYGHQEGDKILKKVAQCLKNNLKRAGDYTFRLGGEEFGILFYVKNREEAIKLAEKLRKSIENLKIEHKGNSVSDYITISIGLTIIEPEKVENYDKIYKKADDALYKAKKGGRNRVVID